MAATVPIHDPSAPPLSGARTEIKTSTCYMCACRCGIRVHLREGTKGPEVPAGAVAGLGDHGGHAAGRHRRAPSAHPSIGQISQGSMGDSFDTREFFHGRPEAFVQRMRWASAGLGFALPAGLLLMAPPTSALWWALCLLQWPGLLAERWSFFAEGQHTQNLYYRAVG